jgi:hypothetical protein
MSQQTYPVACACGVVHRVAAEDAGSKLFCSCTKLVEVPPFRVLRTLSVDEWGSPEVELDARRGQLPEEPSCAFCRSQTAEVCRVRLCVEKPDVVGAVIPALLGVLPGLLPFNTVGRIVGGAMADAYADQDPQQRDYVAYELPVRVCGGCAVRMAEKRDAAAALRRTPLYVRMMRKYNLGVLFLPSGERVRSTLPPSLGRIRRARRVAVAWTVGLALTFGVMVAGSAIINAMPGVKNMGQQPPTWASSGVLIASLALGIGAGLLVGRWHRARWPEMPG